MFRQQQLPNEPVNDLSVLHQLTFRLDVRNIQSDPLVPSDSSHATECGVHIHTNKAEHVTVTRNVTQTRRRTYEQKHTDYLYGN